MNAVLFELPRRMPKRHPARATLDRFAKQMRAIQNQIREKTRSAPLLSARWNALKTHWIEFRGAWSSAEGTLRPWGRRGLQVNNFKNFLRFVLQFMNSGMTPVKTQSHHWRTIALLSPNSGRRHCSQTNEAVFYASTLPRSIDLPASEQAIDRAREAAKARWQDGSLPRDYGSKSAICIEIIDTLICHAKGRPLVPEEPRKEHTWPEVGDKMVLPARPAHAQNMSDFGKVARCTEQLQLLLRRDANEFTYRETYRPIPVWDRGFVDHLLTGPAIPQPNPAVRDRCFREFFARVEANVTGPIQGPMVVNEFFHRYGKVTGQVPWMATNAIPEMGGKVRLATTHEADEVFISRDITQRWMPLLKKLILTRHVIRGEGVRFKRSTPSCRSRLYSADLSAATDWIPHDLAKRIAKVVNSHTMRAGLVPIFNDLCEIILSAHALAPSDWTECCIHFEDYQPFAPYWDQRLQDEYITRRGIHMGLGPSWVILCLINIAAGLYASQDTNSFRVCGDDLVSDWTPEEVRRYESFLEDLGLKINRSKAFYGPRAVFCELLVTKRANGTVRSKDVGHLAQDAASKWKAKRSADAAAIASSLALSARERHFYARRKVIESTRHVLARRLGKTPGPVQAGGNGLGSFRLSSLRHFLSHPGALVGTRKVKSPWGQDLSSLCIKPHECASNVPYITRTQAEILLSAEERARQLHAGRHPKPPRVLTTKSYAQRAKRIAGVGKKPITWGEVRAGVQALNRRDVTRAARQGRHHPDERRVSRKEAGFLLRRLTDKRSTSMLALPDLRQVSESTNLPSHGWSILSRLREKDRQKTLAAAP
uniref:RNA-dependent RNA polymerase n=1 Tax=Phytophthora palustris narna-like virus 5 TaxID=2976297 RepID=A0A9E9C2B6_9VIRU|nr:RNA-dependent RNA polymerase [Phytophthora palustris narna-like virus 5]